MLWMMQIIIGAKLGTHVLALFVLGSGKKHGLFTVRLTVRGRRGRGGVGQPPEYCIQKLLFVQFVIEM